MNIELEEAIKTLLIITTLGLTATSIFFYHTDQAVQGLYFLTGAVLSSLMYSQYTATEYHRLNLARINVLTSELIEAGILDADDLPVQKTSREDAVENPDSEEETEEENEEEKEETEVDEVQEKVKDILGEQEK